MGRFWYPRQARSPETRRRNGGRYQRSQSTAERRKNKARTRVQIRPQRARRTHLFCFEQMITRPRKGDLWEFKLPGKPKRQKEVGRVRRVYVDKFDENNRWAGQKRIMYVDWKRLPKGRYSGLRVKVLLKHGKRVSTKAERDAVLDAQIARRRAEKLRSGS